MAQQPEYQGFGYQAYQFADVGDFGVSRSTRNPLTGITKPSFEKVARLHFARRNVSVSDRFNVAGTEQQDTVMIVIRHNRQLSNLNEPIFVELDNKLYKCVSYSVNDSTYNAVDLLTLQHISKVG